MLHCYAASRRGVFSMTREQCVLARQALGWTQQKLACRAHCSRLNVQNLEGGIFRSHETVLSAIRAALEAAGVGFVAENGGAGVRLRQPAQDA
jgi:transcriptional regulator with XRE-family HTH domain